ncbi:cytochrome P450 [Xylariales sp. PMI_506]|nr:cytochrome P450 [Xylariales sp. PMI_506]
MDIFRCAGLAILESLVAERVSPRESEKQDITNLYGVDIYTSFILFAVQYLLLKYYRIFLYHKYFSPLRYLPGPKDNHFFFGQTLNLFKADSPTTLHVKWMKQYPDAPFIRYLSFGNKEVLIPTSLAAHKEVLQTQCYSLAKPGWFVRMMREVAGHGLILMEADEHRAHRKMLGGSFALKNIRKLEPIFQRKAKDVCSYFDKRIAENNGKTGVFDCTDTFSKAILDIMGSTILGIDLDYVKPENHNTDSDASNSKPISVKKECSFHEAYDVFFAPSPLGGVLLFLNGWIPIRWIPLKTNREFMFAMKWLNEALSGIISDRYRKVSTEKEAGTYEQQYSRDLVTFVVEESMPGGATEGVGRREFLGHLLEFMAAGHDTSANMLGWSCYIMATNHDIQEKLREEVKTLPVDPSYTDLDKLPYMQNFVNESLRVYSPATTYQRAASKDIIIEGVHIPKGTNMDLCPAVTQLNPTIWGDDAETVDPTRWDRLQGDQLSPYAFSAFSNGPRICIGRQFALFEIKTILAEMVRNFRFLAVEKPFKIENPGFTLRPAGLEVRMERI